MEKLAVWSAFFCKIKGFWCENLREKLVWKYVPERFEWGKTGFLLGIGKFVWVVYMSTENSVNRSLKTRSLLTKFGTCNITATGAVTI